MTTTTNVKVIDFIVKASAELTKMWEGKKFKDISEVHTDIRSYLEEALKQFGKKDLYVTYWSIKSHEFFEDIFRYDIDMKRDNRVKYKIAGTVNSISLFPTNKVSFDVNNTIDDLLKEVEKLTIENRIKNVMNQLSEAYSTVSELETALRELQEQQKNI